MKTYDVSFVRNEVAQANLANAESEEAVRNWFELNKPDAHISGIREATADSFKPGKPCIEVGE